MHGVTVSWVGQSFTLPICSASSENKPRTRRTKEERRTMVMSFIKKYQSLNNGKFPSLNLTHKEVGGSFYTVREIVRDIIQENKVLAPGKPSSRLLNLEYYSEEDEGKGSFLDAHRNMSVSTADKGIYQLHHEVASSLEQETPSDENIAVDKPVTIVLSNTYLNEYSSWPLLQDGPSIQEKFSDGFLLHEEIAKTGTKDLNIHVQMEKKDDASGGVHHINAEVLLISPEDSCIQKAKQSVPLYPTSSGSLFIETELKNEDMHNKSLVARNLLEEGTNFSETAFTDSIPGTNMFFSDIVDDQSKYLSKNHNGEVFPLVADNLGQDCSSETPELAVSNTSKVSRSGHKIHLTSEHSVEWDVIIRPELETENLNSTNNVFSTSESSSIANKDAMLFIPFDNEHIKSGVETRKTALFNERKVDLAPGATENDKHLIDKSNTFMDTIKESENSSSNFLKPIIQEADHAELKADKQSVTSDTVNGAGFMSLSNEVKESKLLETNPVWAAIKSLVSSFIKFWSE